MEGLSKFPPRADTPFLPTPNFPGTMVWGRSDAGWRVSGSGLLPEAAGTRGQGCNPSSGPPGPLPSVPSRCVPPSSAAPHL